MTGIKSHETSWTCAASLVNINSSAAVLLLRRLVFLAGMQTHFHSSGSVGAFQLGEWVSGMFLSRLPYIG